MSDRKFRFGVSGRGNTLGEWKDFARKAEDLGYATLVLPDHFSQQLAPLPALVAAAQATNTIRFGTQVLANDFRHPAVLAKEAATVDVLTDGRFDLGIGTGSQDQDNVLAGLPLDPPGVRFERIRETVAILKAFFTEETVTFEGKHYQTKDLPGYPKPVQKPYMPIFIGARGARMLRLAAREADIVGVMAGSGDAPGSSLGEKMAIVRDAAGERYSEIEFTTLFMRVEIDGKAQSGGPNTGSSTGRALPGLVGSRNEVVEKLQENRDKHDISYVIVIGPVMDDFAPIVAKLAGT
jgi:probable F420-dependent oxidoreductase